MLKAYPILLAAILSAAQIQISDAGPARIAKMVKPIYPPDAKAAGLAGRVKLEAVVGKEGEVRDLRVLGGHPRLAEAALEAVRQWKYEPFTKDGQAVEVITTIEVNFTLEGSGEEALNVPGGEQQARLVRQVKPAYPPEAKAAGISGRVRLMAVIDKEGRVVSIEVLEGEPVLAEAAVGAVQQWEYQPTVLDGRPVAVKTQIDVNFTLAR